MGESGGGKHTAGKVKEKTENNIEDFLREVKVVKSIKEDKNKEGKKHRERV